MVSSIGAQLANYGRISGFGKRYTHRRVGLLTRAKASVAHRGRGFPRTLISGLLGTAGHALINHLANKIAIGGAKRRTYRRRAPQHRLFGTSFRLAGSGIHRKRRVVHRKPLLGYGMRRTYKKRVTYRKPRKTLSGLRRRVHRRLF
jgi:hypothetical protein